VLAQTVAHTLTRTKLRALEIHSLIEIQNWQDTDEQIVDRIIPIFTDAEALPEEMTEGDKERLLKGAYAAHVVSAAVIAAAAGVAEVSTIQSRMVEYLYLMHQYNPAWCPLQIEYPGDMSMRLAFPSFGDGSVTVEPRKAKVLKKKGRKKTKKVSKKAKKNS
jgi:hypothetical protein